MPTPPESALPLGLRKVGLRPSAGEDSNTDLVTTSTDSSGAFCFKVSPGNLSLNSLFGLSAFSRLFAVPRLHCFQDFWQFYSFRLWKHDLHANWTAIVAYSNFQCSSVVLLYNCCSTVWRPGILIFVNLALRCSASDLKFLDSTTSTILK